jgi:quercetin dioxygenase-like cupin family protein
MSRFVLTGDVRQESFDWGEVGWRCVPPITGSKHLTVIDVLLSPGGGHDFHLHRDQEEMIIVTAGRIEQWIQREKAELGPGDSVYIDADVVHASFNTSSEDARLQVVLGPAVGEGGYELVDVSGEEPWASLRS